ncbi:hypothetical protein AMTRI_Chr02g256480 [Amborella trichopoda]
MQEPSSKYQKRTRLRAFVKPLQERYQRESPQSANQLLHCPAISPLWSELLSLFGLPWVYPPFNNSFEAFLPPTLLKTGCNIWKISVLAFIWVIWNERNGCIFRVVSNPMHSLLDRIKAVIIFWSKRLTLCGTLGSSI